MSIALLRFILMLSFAKPMAVVLSHKIVVGGCGYPKSAKMVRRPAACCPPVNSAAYSASPADICYDARDDGGDGGDGAIDAHGLIKVAEEEYAANDGPSVRSG